MPLTTNTLQIPSANSRNVDPIGPNWPSFRRILGIYSIFHEWTYDTYALVEFPAMRAIVVDYKEGDKGVHSVLGSAQDMKAARN